MSLLDSESVFQTRTAQFGISPDLLAEMKKRGWCTFASFAFSSTYSPGQSDEKPFVDGVLVPLLGSATHADAPKLRRLLFEAFAMTAADMKSRTERSSEDTPRRFPQAERAARLKRLAQRLPGLKLTDHMKPSNHLVDLVASIVDSGALRYIPWSDCLSRPEEVNGQKRSREWRAGPDGLLREVPLSSMSSSDTSTDLRVMQALHRRGVAAEVGGLMAYEQHDLLAQALLFELQQPVAEGYAPVSHDQLQRADREAFRLLAAATSSGLDANPDGEFPAGKAMESVIQSASVRLMLVPLPYAPAHRRQQPSSPEQPSAKRARTSAKARGKPKPRPAPRLPAGLEGSSRTPDGASICFAYNHGNCPNPNKGCPRGRHVCTKCFKDHSFQHCLSRSA